MKLAILAVVAIAAAQTPEPAFDAASIKLSTEETVRYQGRRIETSPGSLTTHGLTLRACLIWAFGQPAQIVGPDWLNTVTLDINAKAATPAGDRELYQMLKTLLVERMGLKAHFEKREMPVYALTVTKGRPKFSESTTDGPLTVGQDKGALLIQRASMPELAAELGRGMFDRPVIDATGLKGRYDIRLDMASVQAVNQRDRMDAASAMMATLEQLGLKLEARQSSIDVLVLTDAI